MSALFRHLNQRMQRVIPSLLGAETIPEHLIVRPADLWRGDAEIGQALCDGVFTYCGQQVQLHGECWQPVGLQSKWLAYLHGFEWLRDLRRVGSAAAQQQARALMDSWMVQYTRPRLFKGADFTPWDLNLIGKRVSLWIAHYDFFAADADPDFEDLFFTSLYRQASFLVKMLEASAEKTPAFTDPSCDMLQAAKGALFCGLAFEGHEAWVHKALEAVDRILRFYVHKDGMHLSRSPYLALKFLRTLLEVKAALQAGGHPVPDLIQDKIESLVPAVRFFRYADRHFALMQGAMRGDVHYIDTVLAQAAIKGRHLKQLKDSGYTKLSVGRSTILFDHGKNAQHSAPLSFEMNYGKDRVFVNCGSHESNPDWQQMLSSAAAHSALALDGETLAAQLKVFDCESDLKGDYAYVQAAHDGYLASAGLLHRRRLYLSQDGHDVRGEDALFAQIPLMRAQGGVVRFHLHPRITVSLMSDGQAALLRLPNGIGWRFQQSGGRLALEESIYAGDSDALPRKTQQLALHFSMAGEQLSLKWALRREGL